MPLNKSCSSTPRCAGISSSAQRCWATPQSNGASFMPWSQMTTSERCSGCCSEVATSHTYTQLQTTISWPLQSLSQHQRAISYLKHLCLAAPADLQPRDGQGLYANIHASLPHAVASHPDPLVLKECAADVPESMRNLLGPALDNALLEKDLASTRRNGTTGAANTYIKVPTGHLMGCIARSIQGQRCTTTNEANFRRQLEDLGLTVGSSFQPCKVSGG